MSPPPNKIRQRSQGEDNEGVMLEKHMCCMNHAIGYAVFISVTLCYHLFSSHGERVLCPVHFQVKPIPTTQSITTTWCLTEAGLSPSVKQLPETDRKQVTQYVPFVTDL